MTENILIAGIGGSYKTNSSSLAATLVALEAAASLGATVEAIDVWKLDLPMFDGYMDSVPENAYLFADIIRKAHGLILCSPLYHGTVSGVFKNAIDWLELLSSDKYLYNKAVGMVCAAGGTQGLQAINTMDFIVRSLRGWVVPFTVAIPGAPKYFEADGTIKDNAVRNQLVHLGKEVYKASFQLANGGQLVQQ